MKKILPGLLILLLMVSACKKEAKTDTTKTPNVEIKIHTVSTFDIKVEQKEYSSGIQIVNINKAGIVGDYDYKLYASSKDLVKVTITNKDAKFIAYQILYNGVAVDSNDGSIDIIGTIELRNTIP